MPPLGRRRVEKWHILDDWNVTQIILSSGEHPRTKSAWLPHWKFYECPCYGPQLCINTIVVYLPSSFIMIDPRWQHPFTCVVAGPTGCGKTEWVKHFITNLEAMTSPVPTQILWSYGEWQPTYQSLQDKVRFVQGLPELSLYNQDPLLLVIDDQMQSVDQRVIIATSVWSTLCRTCLTSTKNIAQSVWTLIILWSLRIPEMGPRSFTLPSRCIQGKPIMFGMPLNWPLDIPMVTSW